MIDLSSFTAPPERPVEVSESIIRQQTHKKMMELRRGDLIITRTGKYKYLVLEDRLPNNIWLTVLCLNTSKDEKVSICWDFFKRCKVFKSGMNESSNDD